MEFTILVICALLCLAGSRAGVIPDRDPRADAEDGRLSFAELATKYGYPVETHYVQTSDGYILTLYRIPYGVKSKAADNKPVVFLQHGILSSAIDWIIAGPDKGLGYVMADQGYDVWLGNARGNSQSRRHATYDTSQDEFWDFSWHEIGTIDLPALIDYSLATAGQEKLHYIGHSQGTTSFFVMASERPEYNDKIKAAFALAPIAYMSHMTSPLLQLVSEFVDVAEDVLNFLGVNEFLPSSELIDKAGQVLCSDDDITQAACANVLYVVCGFDKAQSNNSLLPIIMGHSPAGASVKQVVHYGQEIKSGYFRKFDYGLFGNIGKYGSLSPPKYDLSKVTAPVALHWSRNDWLSGEKDVDKLYDELPNKIGKFLVPFDDFNHLDYMWAIDVKPLVYDRVAALMKQYP